MDDENKISGINPDAITPKFLLHKLYEQVDTIEHLYVVGIDKEGKHHLWAAGDLSGMTLAQLVLQDAALAYLNGLLDDQQ